MIDLSNQEIRKPQAEKETEIHANQEITEKEITKANEKGGIFSKIFGGKKEHTEKNKKTEKQKKTEKSKLSMRQKNQKKFLFQFLLQLGVWQNIFYKK